MCKNSGYQLDKLVKPFAGLICIPDVFLATHSSCAQLLYFLASLCFGEPEVNARGLERFDFLVYANAATAPHVWARFLESR